jgi:hypothetical protein
MDNIIRREYTLSRYARLVATMNRLARLLRFDLDKRMSEFVMELVGRNIWFSFGD